MIVVRKILAENILIDYKTDLISHPYLILLEIWKLDPQFKKLGSQVEL